MASAAFVVHRLAVGRVVGLVLAVAVGVALVDLVRRGEVGAYGTAVCWMLALLGLVYVLALRPAVLEGPEALEVRNPMRTIVVPWAAVQDVDVVDVLRVRTGDDTYVRCFAVPRRRPAPTALRSAASTGMTLPSGEPGQGWQPPHGEPRAEALAGRLRGLRDRFGRGYAGAPVDAPPSGVRATWAVDALVAIAVAVLLGAAGVVLL